MSLYDGYAYDANGNRVYVGPAPDFSTAPPYGFTWEKQTGGSQNLSGLPVVTPTITKPVDPFYSEWLKANPQAGYTASVSGLDTPLKNWYGSRFNNIYSQYQGDIAKTKDTKLQFSDWLKNFNFKQDYFSNSPYQRGSYENIYAPRTRWLNY